MANKYASTIEQRAGLIKQTNYLPLSWLVKHPVDRNGRVVLDAKNSIQISDKSDNISTNGVHEKNHPDMYGVNVPNTEFYQIHFVADKKPSQTISSSALEIYPLSGQRVNAIVNLQTFQPYTGTAIINYDNLLTQDGTEINVIRLQEFLLENGFEADIETFYDLQKILKDSRMQEMFTPRGLDQLALSSYFIPNAIGETDANSRNILLIIDPVSKKIDSVIRIDADKISTIYSENMKEAPFIAKGIFRPGYAETYEEYMNYIHNHKQFPMIDWELFAGYHKLSKMFLTPRHVQKEIGKVYDVNQGRCHYGYNDPYNIGPSVIALSIQKYEDFISNIDKRIARIHKDIDERIDGVHTRLPFENSPFFDVDPFKTQLFDSKGRPIPVNEIPDGPTFNF